MASQKDKQTDLMIPNGLNDTKKVASVPSTDVFTSYIFSTSNRNLSKYGERLLMEVISVAQEYTIDAALGINKLNFSEHYQEKFAVIDIPVKSLLNSDDSTNYTKAKEAAVELMKIYHTVEAPVLDENGVQKTYNDGTPQYQFASFHLLDRVVVNQKPGIVSVKLGEETWSQILDMGKGYTRYNLLTAKSLDDVVAMRLFQIMSNSSEPLYFSLERLKGILGLQGKYVNNSTGFLRRVIIPAEEEIREKCPFEIQHDLEYQKVSPKGRPSVVGITFRKVNRATVNQNPASALPASLYNLLVKEYGFDERGMRSNLKLFLDVKAAGYNVEEFLRSIEDKAQQANSPQAYMVKSLQNLLEGKKPASRSTISAARVAESAPKKRSKPVIVGGKTAASVEKTDRQRVAGSEAFTGSGLEEL